MYSLEEVWEEQERQYNQLMQEDDQYCHPESFRWGFEHGFEYALTKLGWHPASELPPVDKIGESKYLIVYDLNGYAFSAFYSRKRGWCDEDGRNNLEIEWWCYPPKED